MLDKGEGEERSTKLRDCPLMWTVRGDAIQDEPSRVQIQATVIVDLSFWAGNRRSEWPGHGA